MDAENFGFLLNEKLGKIHFWTFLIGFHLTFFPMHFMGLNGMPRRVYTYLPEDGLFGLNFVSTIGAFIMAASVLLLLYNIWYSYNTQTKDAGGDPWNGRTLEWAIASPAPSDRWKRFPVINHREPLWEAKKAGKTALEYTEHEERHLEEHASSLPVIISAALFIAAFGFVFEVFSIAIAGLAMTCAIMIYRSLTFDKNIEWSGEDKEDNQGKGGSTNG